MTTQPRPISFGAEAFEDLISVPHPGCPFCGIVKEWYQTKFVGTLAPKPSFITDRGESCCYLALATYPNGWGLSVIRYTGSMAADRGYEVCLIVVLGDDWKLVPKELYGVEPPLQLIPDGYSGGWPNLGAGLTPEHITQILNTIKSFPPTIHYSEVKDEIVEDDLLIVPWHKGLGLMEYAHLERWITSA